MTLKLHEVINLYYELNGVTKQTKEGSEVVSLGILKQKMSLKSKVYLQRLNKVVSDEIKLYEDAKKELFEKYGKQEGDSMFIPAESIESFNQEHFDLLTAEKNVDISTLWGSDLTLEALETIETDEFYPQLFDLIDNKK
jgi:hypothetical protein